MFQLCWIRRLDVNKYWQVDALFTPALSSSGLSPLLPGRFTLARAPVAIQQQPAVSRSQSGDVRAWQKRNSNPRYSHCQTDLNCVYKFRETTNYIQLCFNVQDRWLSAAVHQSWRHITKITSNVTNEILKMSLPKYSISRTQPTADIVSQYRQSCSLEWLKLPPRC